MWRPVSIGDALLLTPSKEIVMAPELLLNAELEALLQRLMQVENSKWQALRELGLMAGPAREGRKSR